jgi:hypothetical protein
MRSPRIARPSSCNVGPSAYPRDRGRVVESAAQKALRPRWPVLEVERFALNFDPLAAYLGCENYPFRKRSDGRGGAPSAGLLAAEASPPLDRHPVVVYLSGLSPGSRGTMQGALKSIAATASSGATEVTFPWRLDVAHTSAIRAQLAERYAPSMANRMLAGLRGVLTAAGRLGLMTADQMTRAWAVGAPNMNASGRALLLAVVLR